MHWIGEHRAIWAAATLLVAALMLFAVLQQRSSSAAPNLGWIEAIAPRDVVGRAIATRDRPPALETLLFVSAVVPGVR